MFLFGRSAACFKIEEFIIICEKTDQIVIQDPVVKKV